MENFKNNKIFGDIFCRYLKEKFNWLYEAVDPCSVSIPNDYPDVDIFLSSKNKKSLYLQLKQPIEFEKCNKIMTKSTLKVFKNRPFEVAIEKAEKNYTEKYKNISNIILILHIHKQLSYLMPEDVRICEIQSDFRGIYVVSPKFNAWQDGEKILEEFVAEIKNAFETPTRTNLQPVSKI